MPGLDKVSYVTSDTIWSLPELPKKLLVLGSGPIGCELAQCFNLLGSEVPIVERLPQLLIREDQDAAVYTYPEVARVGLNDKEAKQADINYEITQYEFNDLDRAIAGDHDLGFVKVLTATGRDKILGASIIGSHAGDLLAEFTLAIRYKLGLNKIPGTIHPYPTMSEANKATAGMWKKNHAPQTLLRWVEQYFNWTRKKELS